MRASTKALSAPNIGRAAGKVHVTTYFLFTHVLVHTGRFRVNYLILFDLNLQRKLVIKLIN